MVQKKKKNKAFWNNIKFKYKLIILNENTLEEVFGLRVSKLNGVSVLLLTLTILFLFASVLLVLTPLRNYLPGYMNSEVRNQVVENVLRVDSLEQLVNKQNLYIMNIQDIFNGELHVDSLQSMDSITVLREDSLIERSEREKQFRKQYEEREAYNLTSISSIPDAEGLIFYRPALGLISKKYNPEQRHYGTDIAVGYDEGIQAVLDGTVILSNYTAEDGYILTIQHKRDFLSVYKQCGSLMKQVGNKVRGGEVIALTAQKKNKTVNKPHVHVELWHRGKSVDPEKYIVF